MVRAAGGGGEERDRAEGRKDGRGDVKAIQTSHDFMMEIGDKWCLCVEQ